jgi:ADP-ribose pyrophosphatase YjhB (NUDIX family)
MSKRSKKLKMSGGAMHARAQFQEGKHKRDMSGKFADMPGSTVPGAAGSQAAPIVPAAKADWFSAAKSSQIKGDDRIKLHVTSNPKKPGSMSAERFAHYQDGMTVADFKKAGGLPEDLAHDRKKGFVTFHDSETYGKLSTAGASPVSQINHATASGRLASIKAGAEAKAATVTAETKPAEPTMPVKATGEPPEPPPPPKPEAGAAKPGAAAPKPAAAAPASPASPQKPSVGTETPPVVKNAPTATPVASTAVTSFKKGSALSAEDATLNGVELKSWQPPKDIKGWQKVEGQMPDLVEPPMPSSGKIGSGVIVEEPDGRIWLAKPTGAYGGYQHTFPKGTIEKGEGLSPQANAIKEAYEETGLKVRITGLAGDFKGDTGIARYYHAVREGGTPLDHGPESEAVLLVPKNQLDAHLNKARDKAIMNQHITGSAKPSPAAPPLMPKGAAADAPAKLPVKMPDNHRYKAEELVPLPASKVADEGEAGMAWEYEKEYLQYGGKNWAPGIKSQADFNERYKAAPLTYLSDDQYDGLQYTTVNTKKLPTFADVAPGLKARKRDPEAIRSRMLNEGVTTPPIVLKRKGSDTLRLMAGQSRIWVGLATGYRVPVKILEV